MKKITFPNGMQVEVETIEEAANFVALMNQTTTPKEQTPTQITKMAEVPPPIATQQAPAPAPFQPSLFRAKEEPNKRKRGTFVVLRQFYGLEMALPKSSMFRLFQTVAAAYPNAIYIKTASKSLNWSEASTWEYAGALVDAGLIEKKREGCIAKTTDSSMAEATITMFDFRRSPNNHHYWPFKDRPALAVSASKQQEG